MKRVVCAVLCMVLIIIYSCEKDDFCLINPVTSNLVIRLHDASNEDDTKTLDSLFVWAEGRDTIYDGTTAIDSLAIPLNTLASNTVYHLSQMEDGKELLETFTIEYTIEDVFVSRSCGFRVVFNDVTITRNTTGNTNTWISSFSPETLTTIDNQENAHIKIFH